MKGGSCTCRRVRRLARTERSLIEALQRIIERTYDLKTGVSDIGRFIIGDEGYRRIKAPGSGSVIDKLKQHQVLSGGAGEGARTLVRPTDEGLVLSVYYPDDLVECLETHNPTRYLDDRNIDAFAVLVEELDHFLVIAERYRSRGVMSLLDLELHANVTKYLMLAMFAGKHRGTGRLSESDRAWIRFHLFDKAEFCEPDEDVRSRYREAVKLAARYTGSLDAMPREMRPAELKRFHRMAPQTKIAHIGTAATR